ncbi:MAG: cation:proton antiporter [Candidatus Eiseniibacteriota bacterium]
MHETHQLLTTFAIVLGVAAVTTVVFQRLRQPVIFGYLLAGLVVGPHIPIPLVADSAVVQEMAELGVVLLMFSLGLEFSVSRLAQVGLPAGFVAILQSSLMMSLGYAVSRVLGWTALESIYGGAVIAISSTTIIVKAFREQGVKGPVVDIVFGVLIVEDLIAILLLAILTPISAGRELSAGSLLVTVTRLIAFLAGLLIVGMLLVPRMIRMVTKLNRPETTLVACVGLCFACAWLANSLGYSVALGAFVAGALVAESGEHVTIERLIEPVRDIFAAIFFVAVGMLLDPVLVAEHWIAVVLFTILVVVGKVVFVAVSVFLTGRGVRLAAQAGMSLAQFGEFSFILAGVAVTTGASGAFLYPVAVAVSAVTTLLTPWLIRAADPVSTYLDRSLPQRLQTFVALYGSWIENLVARPVLPAEQSRVRRAFRVLLIDAVIVLAIVVAGSLELVTLSNLLHARTGMSLPVARASVIGLMLVLATPFLIGIARTAATLAQTYALRALPAAEPGKVDFAAAPRRAMAVTLRLAFALVLGAPLVAITQPLIPAPYGLIALSGILLVIGFAFWQSAANLHGHTRASAELIVAALSKQSGSGGEKAKRKDEAAEPATVQTLETIYQLIPGLGTPVPVQVEAGSPVVGRSLRSLALRAQTGATVLAILRGDQVILVPEDQEALAAGDVLALAGSRDSLEDAKRFLREGKVAS